MNENEQKPNTIFLGSAIPAPPDPLNLQHWSIFIGKTKSTYDIHSTNPIIKGLLDKIIPMGETFIEWGFGTGYTAIALANRKKKVIAYDPAPGLCETAYQSMLDELVSPAGKVEFISDVKMFKNVMADIVYSQGLLEHFDDEAIVAMIREQLQYARIAVVFSVPSENYKTIDFGDERLMDIAKWETILAPFKETSAAPGMGLTQLYYYERRQQLMGVIKK
jgi:hypothetical protein